MQLRSKLTGRCIEKYVCVYMCVEPHALPALDNVHILETLQIASFSSFVKVSLLRMINDIIGQ
jgi:hypothetical protein